MYSSLCLGLDLDPEKLPSEIGNDLENMESFAKDVIDATISFCPVYKPNLAVNLLTNWAKLNPYNIFIFKKCYTSNIFSLLLNRFYRPCGN